MVNIKKSKLSNSPIIVNSPQSKVNNRKSKNSLRKKKPNKNIYYIATIIMLVLALLTYFGLTGDKIFNKNSHDSTKVHIEESNLERSPVIVDSPGAIVDNSVKIEKKPDKIIRSIEIKVNLDSLPLQRSNIREGTSVGLANVFALFTNNKTRYRFITDYQFTISRLEYEKQRLTLNYKLESPDQLIGKEISVLKNINMLVINYSEFLKTINLDINENIPLVYNWDMYLNGIKVVWLSEEALASTILNGQALIKMDFNNIEESYNALSK